MISREQAMGQADLALEREHWEAARAWAAYAAELRQQSEPAGERLTLHDIEARICDAHALIAVRSSRASMSWWMHVANHTMCTDVP